MATNQSSADDIETLPNTDTQPFAVPVLSKKDLKQKAKEDAKRLERERKQTKAQLKLDAKNAKLQAKEDLKRRKTELAAKAIKEAFLEQARQAEEKEAKKQNKRASTTSESSKPRPSQPAVTSSQSGLPPVAAKQSKLSGSGKDAPTPQAPRLSVKKASAAEPGLFDGNQNTWRARSAVTREVKDLTLTISGLYDQVQKTRSSVLSLELTNSDLAKEVKFHSNAYRTLRKDLRHVKRDYKKADAEYNKGRAKASERKHYLKKNSRLQGQIVENNMDLLAEMTVNDEVIPGVCRQMRETRLKEQGRCLRQLRHRLATKKAELAQVKDLVMTEEMNSDSVCRLSERLQHQLDDQGYVEHETYNVAQLRSVAYCLGYVQYQVEDLTRETEFTREMNASRMNEFNNELNWRVLSYRERMQALQASVAKALHPTVGVGRATEKVTTVSSCVKRVIPEAQKEWMASQIELSEVQKEHIEAEFALLSVEVLYLF
ncbi:hypothetical protein BV898_01729 [Hypsibius exemplaris]|uniref:DUF4201 domain-containing protein n=1 Tax=Hypsibius exemplaris TaxID=2072580 RepID=A0A1W0XB64_HYPEX|nr:hypothetical protein BV898_01729 [Hypsibius exemplaris]